MKHKKIMVIGVVLLAISFIVMALSNSTYALFSNDVYGANTNSFTTGMLLIEASSKTDTISLDNVLPMSDEEGLKTNPYVFTIKNIGNLDYLFDVKLLSSNSVSSSFSPQYIKLQIDDGDVITLSSLSNGEIKSDITLLAGESMDVSIRVWISIDTPNSEIGKSFKSKIVTDGKAVYTSSNNVVNINAAQYITSLYTGADKTVVNNIDNSIQYNQAQSVSLMNDRLGGTTTGYDSGNIRYYGTNPNNYIYFNCSSYYNQNDSTCEKWRIIGVFDGKIKIIRDAEATATWNVAWDNDKNDWSAATVKTRLNETYYTTLKTKNSKTVEFISESTWYLGGYTTGALYPEQIYNFERKSDAVYGSNPYTINANLGLMYASDYGYATDLGSCNKMLGQYNSKDDSSACKRNNWLFNSSLNQWFITPTSDSPREVFAVASTGQVGSDLEVNSSYAVRPVLYLNTDVKFNDNGNGTSDNPYQIKVNYTPYTDFQYILGDGSVISNSYPYGDSVIRIRDLDLEANEMLLYRYIGVNTEVNVPSSYVIDGKKYNVIMMSNFSDTYDYTNIPSYDKEPIYVAGVFMDNKLIKEVILDDDINMLELGDNSNSFHRENSADLLFKGCTSLEFVPVIPNSVISMDGTFRMCTNLSGYIDLGDYIIDFDYAFDNTTKEIYVGVNINTATYLTLNNIVVPDNVKIWYRD